MPKKSETESAAELSSKFTVLNPEKDVDDCIARKDWFTGFAISVSYFEHYGSRKIKAYCETHKMSGYKDTLENMGAKNIAFVLRVLGFIDDSTYTKMKKTIEERNKLVHPSREGIDYRYRKEENRATQLLLHARECIHNIS